MRRSLTTLALLAVIGAMSSFSGQDHLVDPTRATLRLVSQLGHTDVLTAVAFSADGRRILTGSGDGTVRLWDPQTGLEIRSFGKASIHGTDMTLDSPVFSPSGKEIATGGIHNHASLWDIATGQEIRRFGVHQDMVGAVAFSSNGRYLLTGSADGSAALWDREKIEPLYVFSGGFSPDMFVGFSADGRYIVAAGSAFEGGIAEQDVLVCWSISGKERFRLVWDGVGLRYVAISDVSPLLAVTTDDQTVTLVSLESGQAVGQFRDPGVGSVAFLPDGQHIVTANGQAATVWSVASGQAVQRLVASGHGPTVVSASRDGRYVLTGGKDRTARIWALDSGVERMRLEGKATRVNALAFSADGQTLHTATPFHSISAWSLVSGKAASIFQSHLDSEAIVFSPDGRFVALGRSGGATVVSLDTGSEIQHIDGSFELQPPMAFSPDGKELIAVDHGQLLPQGGYAPRLRRWSVATGQEREADRLQNAVFSGIAYSPDERYMAMAYLTMSRSGPIPGTGRAKLDLSVPGIIDVQSPLVLIDLRTNQRIELEGEFTQALAFSPNSELLATGHIDGDARVWSVRDGREVWRFSGHPGAVRAVAFSPTMPILATGSADMTRLWDMKQGREIARLLSPTPGAWTVVDLGGRFDSYDLEAVQGMHWVVSDDPLTPLPLEVFMRDYYEPRLLPRLLTGEALPAIRDIGQLNRVQPHVEITHIDVVPGHSDEVQITVEAESQSRTFPSGYQKLPITSGVYDLRLFRDGQLVAQWPSPAEQPSGHLTITTSEALQAWRDASVITRDGRSIRTFLVRLPRRPNLDTVEFTAYAFNADRIKSVTARKTFRLPAPPSPELGRAYVISVGVTTTQDPYWSLDFAGADARLLRDQFTAVLRQSGAFADVVPVTLVNRPVGPFARGSNETLVQPTKANIRAVLRLLAGQDVAPVLRNQFPESVHEHLQPVAPQDLVVLSFSTHGVRDDRGLFYLFPYDIGSGSGGVVTKALQQQAISSEELSLWLRGIDAQVVLILGTCYSFSAVEGGGFKPGPLGDRGLGQLAYDKGMPVLVSSQSSSWEVGGHGLLAYALGVEGLRKAMQQSEPMTLTDVLQYAEARVPALYTERIGGTEAVEQPVLFDFRQKKQEIVLAVK
jgi:WD40 repeat protein